MSRRSTTRSYFNPRAPCGARPTLGLPVVGLILFQSTRPVRGATKRPEPPEVENAISIHAPRAGRDCSQAINVVPLPPFQSTRPVRGATLPFSPLTLTSGFQSTRPVRGATALSWHRSQQATYFNPRAPCGARRIAATVATPTTIFQSTRPVRGATVAWLQLLPELPISIHAPRAGRDVHVLSGLAVHHISIHAPRAGRDLPEAVPRWSRRNFNPRAPCGARLHPKRFQKEIQRHFNPRAPCGARPGWHEHRLHYHGISIHAPRAGRDSPETVPKRDTETFQSTRPVRGATTWRG